MANYFDTGILLTAGFSLSSQAPLDGRSVVELLTDLDTHIAENRAYEGMCVYVKENKKNYIYNGTTWEEFVGGGGSSEKQIKDWVSGDSYLVGDYIYLDGKLYRCLITNSDIDFDEANWEQLVGGEGGASEAEFVSYDNESLPSVTNVEECLDAIIAKIYYVNPSITSFTCNPSRTAYGIGEKVASVTFTWAYNKDMVSQTLTGCDLADETVRTATYNTEFNSNKTFTLSASDGTNNTSANKSFTFQNKVHHGSASIPATYDSAFILSLNGALKGSKSGTYTVNVGTNQYFYIAMPTSFNNSDVLVGKVGGFDTEFGKVATVSHTNASGYTCDYNIYKSTNSNLGSISMVI